MTGARAATERIRAARESLAAAAPRAFRRDDTRVPTGQALLALQRSAGNSAVSALMSARMRFPGAQAVSEIDGALRELRHDEPAIDIVETGLKAAKATGVPVELEGPKPPAAALAVTRTGFGPALVPPKKPVPPAKPVPAKSRLGRAGAKAKRRPAKGRGPAPTAAPTPAAGAPAAATAAPTTLPADQLLQPPVPPTRVAPGGDPAFAKVVGGVTAFAKNKRSHPPASSKAKEAQDAALAPADDLGGQAKAAKVDTMDAQRPGSFDKKAFIAAVKTAIEAKSPKTLKEADNFKESGKAGEVKGEIKGLVTGDKEGEAKDIETATEAPPDQSKAIVKPVTPMGPESPGEVAAVPAAGAVPKRAPAEQLNLEAGKHEANQEMAAAEVTEPQLAQSNEPQFQQALTDKQAAAAHADTAPGEFRKQETDVIQQGQLDATTTTTAGIAGMQSAKGAALAKLVADKGKTKTKDEAKRAEVTAKVQSIFAATETDVKKILDGIDPKVDAEFEKGEAGARSVFETYVAAKMSAYKEDRYSGWLGGLRWAKDKLFGMPDKVNEFYEAGRELYLKKMDDVISRVADIVGNDLNAAKMRIARGKNEIATYVKSLPTDLKKVGADASQEIGERFEQLESEVASKQESVVDTLASKYVEARKGLDDRIEELQAENKGLVDKAIGAIKAVINTIRELVAMLTSVLARVASVVGDIIKHPVAFLGNLIAGIKGGILKFKDNILDHLRKGLLGWLFGSLAEAGVELPGTFDIKGIIKLLAGIFGLTWNFIRTRIVKQIGEKAMGAVESGVSIFQKLASEGIGGLWEMLLEKLGDIKEMILGQVKDFVVTKIITAGITWLIGLLNPAAAFIKACKLIYDIVMFFVDNAARIGKFVNTIIDSVADIVRGSVGAVVDKIENVLGQMVPIIIGFLASVIGLGGIGQKIRSIVDTLQKPIRKALDFVIKTGLKLAGPIIRGIKGISGKVKAKVAAGKAWVKGKAEAGKQWVKGKLTRSDAQKERDLRDGLRAADALLARRLPRDRVDSGLLGIKSRYKMEWIRLVVAGHRSGQDIGHFEAKVNPEGRSEDRPVEGAYESIDPTEKRRESFRFGGDDSVSSAGGVLPQLTTLIEYWEGPNKKGQGKVVNAFDVHTKELIMKAHFLDQIPSEKRWIEAPDVPIVPGRGTRLITYVNLRQLRRFEKDAGDRAVKAVKDELRAQGMATRLDPGQEAELRRGQRLYGAIKHVTLENVENIPALLQLRRAMLRPGADVNEAIMNTASIPYVRTILAQVGGRIKSAKVSSSGDDKELGALMRHYEQRAPKRLQHEVRDRHEALLVEYGVTRETLILTSFDVHLEIEPFAESSKP